MRLEARKCPFSFEIDFDMLAITHPLVFLTRWRYKSWIQSNNFSTYWLNSVIFKIIEFSTYILALTSMDARSFIFFRDGLAITDQHNSLTRRRYIYMLYLSSNSTWCLNSVILKIIEFFDLQPNPKVSIFFRDGFQLVLL